MNDQPTNTGGSVTNVRVAKEVEGIKLVDPGLHGMNFENLGQAVQFADLMSRAGPMVPKHVQNKPAVALAVVTRAMTWGFDPFALADETYQAKDGGPIGYQAKVFGAALRSRAGIQLKFDFHGEFSIEMKPAKSARGNEVAPRTAKGDRRVVAWAIIGGERLEYETPKLDEVGIKNSPLWHNDPDQQLCYYATRGWARRHAPDVMMGAYSIDEVKEMGGMRDVTPDEPARSGFQKLAQEARRGPAGTETPEEGEKATTEPETEPDDASEPEPGEQGSLLPDDDVSDGHWTDAVDTDQGAPTDVPWDEGVDAAQAGEPRTSCPYEEDMVAAASWLAAWDKTPKDDEG